LELHITYWNDINVILNIWQVLVLWIKCCESLEANHLDLGQCSWIWNMKWISWPGNDIRDRSFLNFSVFEKRFSLHVSSRTLVKEWKRKFKYEIQYVIFGWKLDIMICIDLFQIGYNIYILDMIYIFVIHMAPYIYIWCRL
jgi:hypothetical protein